jgi:DNA-binding NtrC family response regulator
VNQNRYEEIIPTRGLGRRRVWPAWGILMTAIILTTLVTLYMKTDVDIQAKTEFLFACNEIRVKIDDRLQAYEQIFRERMNEIDLVMLDYKMPKMNGVEAFGELIRIKPDVKVILSSGYTEDVVMNSFPGRRPARVLHKPYNMDDLKVELDRLLGTEG